MATTLDEAIEMTEKAIKEKDADTAMASVVLVIALTLKDFDERLRRLEAKQ